MLNQIFVYYIDIIIENRYKNKTLKRIQRNVGDKRFIEWG